MELQLASYELSKLAKEIGFDYPVQRFYNSNNVLKWCFANGLGNEYNNSKKAVSAPTIELLKKWFFKKYEIEIYAKREGIESDDMGWVYHIVYLPEPFKNKKRWVVNLEYISKDVRDGYYESSDEALEAGLFRAAEIVKERLNKLVNKK